MMGADMGPPIDVTDVDTSRLVIALQAKADAWQPGRWKLQALLGRGGSGVVFQAADRRLGDAALKFVSTGTAVMQQKAKREMAILQRVHHPNICAVHGSQAFAAGQVFCLVLELLDAGSLQQRLANAGPLPEPEVVWMASHVLAALACAHSQDIVHRDIKPANILIQSQGPSGQPVYKVCDFGIAVATRRGQASMQTTMQTGTFGMEAAIGTPHYMSPEQLQAGEEPDSRTDLWSLGVVMSECFMGK
jgi:serine/threonine protein kinase